jgi:prepilin peptidase CpaA
MHSDLQSLSTVVLVGLVVAVAAIDIRAHRIPNLLLAPAAALGCALQIWAEGWQGLYIAGGGFAVGLCMFLPFYLLRAFGAGDVKALAAVGTFLGVKLTVLAAAFTLIAGAILGLMIVWMRKASALSTLYRVVGVFAAPRSLATASRDGRRHESERFPYGAAIAFGVLATLFWSGRIQTIN